MIRKFEFKGYYIDECGLSGERKSDDVVPGQQNTIQASENRWIVLYETRGFRGVDDNRSIVYQVRKDSPFGQVLGEGFLEQSITDWNPFGDGRHYMKECNHVTVFGVPESALINGKRVPHEGVFVASWRVNPRVMDMESDYLFQQHEKPLPSDEFTRCHWVQFKLNKTGDDIMLMSEVSEMRQVGFESGLAPCSESNFKKMGQSFVNPVPGNEDCTEWISVLNFDWIGLDYACDGFCMAIRFRWNGEEGRYEWVDCGPRLEGIGDNRSFESVIVRHGEDWLIASRILPRTYGNLWFRLKDPLGNPEETVFSEAIRSNCPRTLYPFPDGVLRVITTDQIGTPYDLPQPRIPLHIMDICPENGFAVTRTEVLFDSIQAGLPIPLESAPSIHFGRLLPHMGGNKGYINYFIRPRGIRNRAYAHGHYKGLITSPEIEASGAYYSEITYDRDYPPTWNFCK